VRTGTQRARVYEAIQALSEATPEQVVAFLERRGDPVMLMSCRPRCSELARLGFIVDTGKRGKGHGGSPAMIWRPTTELERAAWLAEQAAEAEAVAQ
jgi:hypothetical protein